MLTENFIDTDANTMNENPTQQALKNALVPMKSNKGITIFENILFDENLLELTVSSELISRDSERIIQIDLSSHSFQFVSIIQDIYLVLESYEIIPSTPGKVEPSDSGT